MPSAADVGADPAGAASTVAGDLSTHESLTTTAHGGIVASTDPRLTDARTPLAHTHGQSDVTGLVADMAGKQPLDSDLTAIAALSTTAFGRSLLEVVDAVGGRAALSAAAATHAHDGADITSGTVDPARLGSGVASAGQVLTSDGSAASWQPVRWKAPARISGAYYGNPQITGEGYYGVNNLWQASCTPFWAPVGGVAALNIIAIGTTARQLRMCLYSTNLNTGLPDGEPLICETGVFTIPATGSLDFLAPGTIPPNGPFTDFVPVWAVLANLSSDPIISSVMHGYGNNVMPAGLWDGSRVFSRGRDHSRWFGYNSNWLTASPAFCPATLGSAGCADIRVKTT